MKTKKEIEALFSRHLNAGQVKYLKAGHLDVLEQEREGAGFRDPFSGRRLLDCFSSAGSFNVSRHNPVVMQALEEALNEVDLGSYSLHSPYKAALLRKLIAIAPEGLDAAFFAAGGGDAVDAALKLARAATGRSEIISTIKAYHGHTGFALSANGKEHYRHYCEPLMPDFRFVPFNDIEAMRAAISEKTAAVILEPVQGEAGIFPADTAYLEAVRACCDEAGAILVFDEIQTGFGRTGKCFACEHSGVSPDVMTVAKSLGGGLFPNAAVLYRKLPAIEAFLEAQPDFHPSFVGGTDLGCRVSLSVLDYLEEHRLWENAAIQGAKIKQALENLRLENPRIIREVRGVGMMMGLEYVHEFMGPMMSDALAKRNIFAAYSGNAPQVMRFMAPITVNDNEVDQIIEAIRGAVRDMKLLLPFALLAVKIPGILSLLNSERVQTVLFGFIRRIEDCFKRGSH